MLCVSVLYSVNAFAVTLPAKEVPSFSDGSTVACTAHWDHGNDGKNHKAVPMEVFYRIDSRMTKAHAYFRNGGLTIGDYGYDGSCGTNVCSLSIRDLRTNTVSNMNAGYSALNNYGAQIQIMNFKEDLRLTLVCNLTK